MTALKVTGIVTRRLEARPRTDFQAFKFLKSDDRIESSRLARSMHGREAACVRPKTSGSP